MNSNLQLIDMNLSDEDLQSLTLEFSHVLNDETDINAVFPEEPVEAGSKGDVSFTVGQLVLTALSSGTIVALFNVIRSYIDRKPTLEFEFKRKDGQEMRIKAEQLSSAQLEKTVKMANQFLGENV